MDMATLSQAVNRMAWWIADRLGRSENFDTLCYIGTADVRYTIIILAAVKCGWRTLLVSSRNRPEQNFHMISETKCKVLLYSKRVESTIKEITQSGYTGLKEEVIPLQDFINIAQDVPNMEYNKSFVEAVNDPVLVLHSSGSTGCPKLVQMTHGSFAVVDSSRNIPLPAGRRAQNASLFDFGEQGGRFYPPFPPFHLAGIQSYVSLPIFSESATLVLGPQGVVPSGPLVKEILTYQHVRALYLPPAIIEQWMAEPEVMQQARNLDFIIFGGGPLAPALGAQLEKYTTVCQTYGSLETAGVQLLVPGIGEWQYLEFNPYEECDMQDQGDGTYELVLHQRPELAWRRALTHNMPGVKTWRTKDLFIRHPSKPQLWQFSSRLDDLVVMSSGLKLQPVRMEILVQGHPLVSGALIAGQGRPQPVLLVEPANSLAHLDVDHFINSLWSSVEQANEIAPQYGRISRSKIIVATPQKPFLRAAKGTVIRKLTTDLYSDEIAGVFDNTAPAHQGSNEPQDRDILMPTSIEDTKPIIQMAIISCLKSEFSEVDATSGSFFDVGLDSAGMAELARQIRIRLHPTFGSLTTKISLRLLYRFPTISALADAIAKIFCKPGVLDDRPSKDVNTMKSVLSQVLSSHQVTKLERSQPQLPQTDIEVVLLGPRGSLGPQIARSLLHNKRVVKLHCLNRSADGRRQLQSIFQARGFGKDWIDAHLEFYTIDLSAPKLGLSNADWTMLQERVHVIIHNAWKVDFSLPLSSFVDPYLQSVRTMHEFCVHSKHNARLVFCSSIASLQDWEHVYPGQRVPEVFSRDICEHRTDFVYQACSPLGYGQSKQVAERVLLELGRATNTPITVLRIGQIAGPSTYESVVPSSETSWGDTEWIPAMVKISKAVGMLPVGFADIDWIPVDTVGHIISELALSSLTVKHCVFNIVHPHPSPGQMLLDVVRARPGNQDLGAVQLSVWVDHLSTIEAGSDSHKGKVSAISDHVMSMITRMMPWFEHLKDTLSDGNTIQPSFGTDKASDMSPTFATMRPVSAELIDSWLRSWGV
ncbi:MAG: hypothetical protein Q9159_002424 [Coniocarpon cinnabarinum]